MFFPAEAFLLSRGHQFAVLQQRRRRIMIVTGDPKNVHVPLLTTRRLRTANK